ncbi:class I SAM-dependent methyltransferase [Microbispora cellulosiformans]|uniref:Class I SAM-dependent methyltransferase n=1 Tax=Microbispora cellulosiformans TaxID=2614688 RepID=A0A5J5KC09_9ACTN|nr:class I SAM-dependent methyltransferase [Microbispora cellulosiformans]KAA9381404.1 class I SAM-dependent methyltransferase [Microbispora cellulosiformans]
MNRRPYDDDVRAKLDRKDLLAMQALAPLSSAYLPWSPSAMRPSGVVTVLNEIVIHERRTIVELGAGVSSCYIGRLLRQREGRLWTVEHDERWADVVERLLAREGLSDVVTVVRAPLAPFSPAWPDEDDSWYECGVLREWFADRSIDLLIVDGPPAYQAGRRHSRYPAASFFAPMLADDYTVILDDAHRPGEQDILAQWEEQLDITFDCHLINSRVGIGRSRPAFTV